MKLTRFTMMFAAVACLVGCGQKSGASTESGNADESAAQSAETATAKEESNEPMSPWVFDGNRVVKSVVRADEYGDDVYEFEYDSKGRLTKIATKSDSGTSYDVYDYAAGTGYHLCSNGDTLDTWVFEADEKGHIVYQKESKGWGEKRTFNDKGQLVNYWKGGGAGDTKFTWDDNGKLIKTSSVGSNQEDCDLYKFEYGAENTHHQPFYLLNFLGFDCTSVVSHFPTAQISQLEPLEGEEEGEDIDRYQYEFNEDGTINKVTVISWRETTYTYTYGTL